MIRYMTVGRTVLRCGETRASTVSLQYAGELIAAFIKRAGGSMKGEISIGTAGMRCQSCGHEDGLKAVSSASPGMRCRKKMNKL